MGKKAKNGGITLDIRPKEKKMMMLHFPPVVASKNVHALLESFKNDSEVKPELVQIYEDIANIVDWAIERMRILPPPDKKEGKDEEKPKEEAN